MSARILADSLSPAGQRLTTMEITCHRFVLAEFNTHRMFSRNSASSRAIPVKKQIERVEVNPAFPLVFPMEKKGMQGGDALDQERVDAASSIWHLSSRYAADQAKALAEIGVHKSVTNRLLEPFMWHTIVVTGTSYAYANFFAQRCTPLAQPEIRAVAEEMRDLYTGQKPNLIGDREWHLPYIEDEDWRAMMASLPVTDMAYREARRELRKVSAARCARVSYLTQDGKRDLSEDIALYARLVEADPPHWSPLEHVATPWAENIQEFGQGRYPYYYEDSVKMVMPKMEMPMVGNLVGWRSMRTESMMVPAS